MGPNQRMDNYAKQKGWDGGDTRAPFMTDRQYHRWWRKTERWFKLPSDKKLHD